MQNFPMGSIIYAPIDTNVIVLGGESNSNKKKKEK